MPRVKGQPIVGDELKKQFSCMLTPTSHENLKKMAESLEFNSFSAFIEALGSKQFILTSPDSFDVEEQILTLLCSVSTEVRQRILVRAIERFCV
ncbi:hypothetical protein [Allocoleopsis sp.]|uniref:hypothetical protein n=1 Tax=Allocoleopsis sp. TaxID=3088169 RepID=UPI002FD45E1C